VSLLPQALTFSDVLLKPLASDIKSRSEISLKTRITPKVEIDFPLISINMDCVTGVDMAIAMAKYGGVSFYPRFAPIGVQAKEIKKILDQGFLVIPAVGIKAQELDRVDALVKVGVKIITIDVAHGHLQSCLDFVKNVKSKYPYLEVIAGVVGTYEGARDLFLAGADSVRVGVGPGSICTTRIMTGCGAPQITALFDAYQAAKEFNRPIISDGGTKTPGDIVKALAAGANAVVLGYQLAGSTEAPGKLFNKDGKQYKTYNASTSKTEKLKQFLLNSSDKKADFVDYVEGMEACVPFVGPVDKVLSRLEKGIRSGMSYCGSHNISQLHQKATFIQVTPALISENTNRGVIPLID